MNMEFCLAYLMTLSCNAGTMAFFLFVLSRISRTEPLCIVAPIEDGGKEQSRSGSHSWNWNLEKIKHKMEDLEKSRLVLDNGVLISLSMLCFLSTCVCNVSEMYM
jgi:hypothetical protein